jgi:hypothetical protein
VCEFLAVWAWTHAVGALALFRLATVWRSPPAPGSRSPNRPVAVLNLDDLDDAAPDRLIARTVGFGRDRCCPLWTDW